MKKLVDIVVLLMPVLVFAQVDSLWSRTYGSGVKDVCTSVIQTSDGGFLLGGYSDYFNHALCWIVKTNENGDSLWSRSYGEDGICNDIIQADNGDYVLAGKTGFEEDVQSDIFVTRTDQTGQILWTSIFGGPDDDACNSIQETADGGIILAGSSRGNSQIGTQFLLMKIDSSGDSLWCRLYGEDDDEICNSVQQTTDGGFILGGIRRYNSYFGWLWAVKTDSLGNAEWRNIFPDLGDSECRSVQQTADGGYILGGLIESSIWTGKSFLSLKLDASGNFLWSRMYGGEYTFERCYSIRQMEDGGYIMSGYSSYFGAGNGDFLLLRTDVAGDSMWSRTFGGSEYECCYSAQQTYDDGYVLAGMSRSFGGFDGDFWLVKTSPEYFSIPEPSNVTVSDDECGQITIRWEYNEYLPDICKFRIFRDGQLIDSVSHLCRNYTDSAIDSGEFVYRINAVRCLSDGSEETSMLTSSLGGYAYPLPPTPHLISVSRDSCEQVGLRVRFYSINHLDSIDIFRDGELLYRFMDDIVAGYSFVVYDNYPPPGPHVYTVAGWSERCGNGAMSGEQTGQAVIVEPIQSLGIPEENCHAITLTWEASASAVSSRIYRDGELLTTVEPEVTLYVDVAPEDLVEYSYSVTAFNGTCESEPATITAMQLGYPSQTPELREVTTHLPGRVFLMWDRVDEAFEYEVFRDEELLAIVVGSDTTYTDSEVETMTDHEYRIAVDQCDSMVISDRVIGRAQPGSYPTVPFLSIVISEENSGIVDLAVGDIDWDGDMDVAAVDMFADKVVACENLNLFEYQLHTIDDDLDGACAIEFGYISTFDSANIQACGKFASDIRTYASDWGDPWLFNIFSYESDSLGKNDIIIAENYQNKLITASVEGKVIRWEESGFWALEPNDLSSDECNIDRLKAAYIGDGPIDIICSSRETGKVYWWDGETDGNYTEHEILSGVYLNAFDIANMDRDFDKDLLCATTSGDILWFENTGNESFVEHEITNGMPYPFDIEAVDINLDGFMDFVIADSYADEISWWRNSGNGDFRRNIIADDFTQARAIEVVDFDDDGDLDIVGAGQNGIVLWMNLLFISDENPSLIAKLAEQEERKDKVLETRIDGEPLPTEFELHPSYPNPFNATTTISFSLPVRSEVQLMVHDVLGRTTETLISGSIEAGNHSLNWGCPECATGVYFITIHAGKFQAVQKALLIK